jgi:hypothetical protein
MVLLLPLEVGPDLLRVPSGERLGQLLGGLGLLRELAGALVALRGHLLQVAPTALGLEALGDLGVIEFLRHLLAVLDAQHEAAALRRNRLLLSIGRWGLLTRGPGEALALVPRLACGVMGGAHALSVLGDFAAHARHVRRGAARHWRCGGGFSCHGVLPVV